MMTASPAVTYDDKFYSETGFHSDGSGAEGARAKNLSLGSENGSDNFLTLEFQPSELLEEF